MFSGAKASKKASRTEVQQRAYEIYLQRGGSDGHAIDDWLQAEQELKKL